MKSFEDRSKIRKKSLFKLVTLSDNDDREVLEVLEKGDYVECYNGNRGTIVDIKDYNYTLNLDGFVTIVTIHDIKSYKFIERCVILKIDY